MLENFYAEQTLLSFQIHTIDEQRKKNTEFFKWCKENLPHQELVGSFMQEQRGIDAEAFYNADIVFVDDPTPLHLIPEEFRHESYGWIKNNRIIYEGRMVYPVKDVNGDVMGYVGWDPTSDVKYLDSRNYGYKAKRNCFYGMEILREAYQSTKPVIVVEGLVDCILLRNLGCLAFALLGSSIQEYVETVLKRFGDRLVIIPDNDNFDATKEGKTAGESFTQQALRKLPEARVYQTIYFNDLNDVWRSEEHKKAFIEDIKNIDNMFYPFSEIRQRFNNNQFKKYKR